jgi:hypothetical protein
MIVTPFHESSADYSEQRLVERVGSGIPHLCRGGQSPDETLRLERMNALIAEREPAP